LGASVLNRAVATIGIVVSITALVLISPMGLIIIDGLWRNDWHHLADIGQTYGVVSAIFAALAVVGVAASLIYQARSHRLAQVQAIRGTQREILNRVMDNPTVYGPALGFTPLRQNGTLLEQRLMVTAWVGYLYSAYDSGIASEADLRRDPLAALFSNSIGRKWWENENGAWTKSEDPKERRFARILDDAYKTALATGIVSEETSAYARHQIPRTNYVFLALAAAIGGLVGGFVVRHKR
jgi:hypothetical protein